MPVSTVGSGLPGFLGVASEYLISLQTQIDELERIKQYHRGRVNDLTDYLTRNQAIHTDVAIARFKAEIALHREILEKLWAITLPVGYVSRD